MDNYNIDGILILLSSNKIRDKKLGLDDLTDLLKSQPANVPIKAYQGISESLVELLTSEHIQYCTLLDTDAAARGNKLSLLEERLSSSAYVLRLFIEKFNNKLKLRTLNFLLNAIPTLIVHEGTIRLIPAVALNLTFGLLSLVNSKLFKLKFVETKWIFLVDKVCEILDHQASEDKTTFNLLATLVSLLRRDTVGLYSVSINLHRTILRLIKMSEKETSNTKLIFNLMNTLIVETHCLNIMDSIQLIKEAWKYQLTVGDFNSESLQLEATLLDVFASELVCNNLPLMEGAAAEDAAHEVSYDLFTEYLLHKLGKFDSMFVPASALSFKEYDEGSTFFGLFEFQDIQMTDHTRVLPWLKLLSSVKLLSAYFEQSKKHEGNLLSYKKAKNRRNFSSILRLSDNMVSFIQYCLDDQESENYVRFGLQLATMYLISVNIDKALLKDLKSATIRKLENDAHMDWALIALIPIAASRNVLTMKDQIKIFKVSLPLIKYSATSRFACALLAKIIKDSSEIPFDSKLRADICDIYEFSDINGPISICDEAFEFWENLHHFSNVNLRENETAESKVLYWLKARWNELGAFSPSGLSTFVSWLCGKNINEYAKVTNSTNTLTLSGKTGLATMYKLWKDYEIQRIFMLQKNNTKRLSKPEDRARGIKKIQLDNEESNNLLSKFLEGFESSNEAAPLNRIMRSFELLMIVDKISGNSNYSTFSYNSKIVFQKALRSLDLHDKEIHVMLLKEILFVRIENIGGILPEFFDLSVIINPLLVKKNDKKNDDDDYGDEVGNTSFNKSFNEDFKFVNAPPTQSSGILAVAVQALMSIYQKSDSTAFYPYLKRIIKIASADDIILCLACLGDFFKKNNCLNKVEKVDMLQWLTQRTAEKLLGSKHNTSNETISALIYYLNSIASVWIAAPDTPLNSDCKDIMDWIVERFNDVQYSGRKPIEELVDFLLNLLIGHDLSHGIVNGGKQRVFSTLIKGISKLDFAARSKHARKLLKYMSKVGYRNQNVIIWELKELYNAPQQKIESSAFYTMMLCQFSVVSYSVMVAVIASLLPLSRFNHMRSYIVSVLNEVSENVGLGSRLELFHYCRNDLIILSCMDLKDSGNIFATWDPILFDIDDTDMVLKKYSIEYAAAYFSRGLNNPNFLRKLCQVKAEDEATLFLHSYHLVVPFSFLPYGIGDSIFEVAIQLLGTKTSYFNEKYRLLSYKYFLSFLDLGTPAQCMDIVKDSFPGCSFIDDLFGPSDKLRRYQNELRIDFPDGLRIINSYYYKNAAATSDFNALTLWVINDLEQSNDLFQQLQCIREIKLLFVIYKEELDDYSFLSQLAVRLMTQLSKDVIHDELFSLAILLIDELHAQEHDFEPALIRIFQNLLIRQYTLKKEIDPLYLSKILLIKNWDLKNMHIWGYCIDALRGESVSENAYQVNDFLSAKGCSKERATVISLLFSNIEQPCRFDSTFKPSIPCLRNVLNNPVPNEYITVQFKLWLIDYCKLIPYVLLTRDDVEFESLAAVIIEDLAEMGSFGPLYRNFYAFMQDSNIIKSSRSAMLCVAIMSYFSTHEAIPVCDSLTKESLNNHPFIIDIDDEIFKIIEKDVGGYLTADSSCMGGLIMNTSSYNNWLLSIIKTLLDGLEMTHPYLHIFYPLCQSSVQFSEAAILPLFSISLYSDVKRVAPWFLQLLEGFREFSPEMIDHQNKFTLLFKMILLLRIGSRRSIQNCSKVYSKLDLKWIYETAIRTSHVKFGYMLFEEVNMETPVVDQNSLEGIYEAIGDIDLLSGLPPSRTLTQTADTVSKLEWATWKSHSFLNAKFDSGYFLGSGNLDSSLVRSTEAMGFYGLSSIVAKNFYISDDAYEWALQLGKWDLPIPETINDKPKSLYSTLKSLTLSLNNLPTALEQSMIGIFDERTQFQSDDEWLSTLTEVSFLKDIADNISDKERLCELIESQNLKDQQLLETLSFRDYKINLQSRYMFCNMLIPNDILLKRSERENLCLVSISQLLIGSKLAVAEKLSQEALRNSFMLEGFLKREDRILTECDWADSDLLRTVAFSNAMALWSANEIKTPIVILKDLLSQQRQDVSVLKQTDLSRPLIMVSNDEISAHLIKWLSESRFESGFDIYDNYIREFDFSISDLHTRAKISCIMGDFLNSELHSLVASDEINERQRQQIVHSKDQQQLKIIIKSNTISERERKDARRHFSRLNIEVERNNATLNDLLKRKENLVKETLHFYVSVLVYSDRFDNDVLDKFCGLWFEHDKDIFTNEKLQQEIASIPSWKFLPWINQIASKLSQAPTSFQRTLQKTMKRILFKLPYESLYSVMSIKLYSNYPVDGDSSILQKVSVINTILKDLQVCHDPAYYKTYVIPIQKFCEKCLELASLKPDARSKQINLSNLKIGRYWLEQLPGVELPLPTIRFPITHSQDGRKQRPYIVKVKECIDVTTTGISLPKVLTVWQSDGLMQKILLKDGNDDLRQDAIMEQVFQQVNNILKHDKSLRKSGLGIRTYTVIPLGPRAGIIEFVANSVSLHRILGDLHKPDALGFDEARRMMKSVQAKSPQERLKTYKKITGMINPQLKHFFFNSFLDSERWFDAKSKYAKSLATSSIVGYILGLGDRHLNNILIDSTNGEPIHIDLGVAFDQGRLLPIPELVPFRLTRDIVDGLGVTGVEGLFRRNCERVYQLLRSDSGKVMCVLNILKWDPLYSWTLSPVKKHKHLLEDEEESELYNDAAFAQNEGSSAKLSLFVDENRNQESYKALKGVEDKLVGSGLSIEATVQELIQQAMDPAKLSVIYMGWSPFY
ncbi:DNA-binding protein kinase TEL1 KNAG_0B02200 [Huiozyma naganishii CBS 8797]|uniref:Serine/threonine-protein kinase Tel1 n=1 Tax=Huiozyma naganishii (strain ATCC MYA-139 / BCRC 22969 / CBS 8797 / KCTC 17520 / NBRC 10181 / NCYC 3082 / Yp74L-3) TaxID=1071383 RepID=J7RUW5_HUIN7|nr:hypothetical protein KNAG_0B02200 [Kazachstania naganishii CBS 8797]CCK68662.1 hypothetical protein KNAG_0B02200 [Kazachstania naganishii CBS 8797]